MSTNTNNLGLFKIDTVTDGQDTFNIDTVLNDNWDKIDTTTGNLSTLKTNEKTNIVDSINELHDNVNTPDESAPTTINTSIYTVSNTVKGQVSVELNGITRTNINVPFSEWTLNAQATIISDRKIEVVSNGTTIANQVIKNIQPNKQYTLSGLTNIDRLNSQGYIDCVVKDSSGTTVLDITGVDVNIKSQTFTTPSNASTIFIRCVVIDSSSGNTYTFEDIILEEGDAVDNFIFGTKSTVLAQRLLSHGKNFTNKSKWQSGKLIQSNGVIGNDSRFALSEIIKIEQNKTYAISFDDSNFTGFYSQGADDTFQSRITIASSPVIFTADTFGEIQLSFRNVDDSDFQSSYLDDMQIMVEQGSSATDYEEYQESASYIYAEDENGDILEAHSLPNGVNDEVSDGKVTKSTEKEVLTGTLSGYQSGQGLNGDLSYASLNISYFSGVPVALVNNSGFGFDGNNYYRITNSINSDLETEHGIRIGTSTNLQVVVPTALLSSDDLAGLQSYFDANPISLIYQLAEEKIYEIPNLNDLYSFDGETTIIIEPAIEFEAIADSSGQITIPNTEYPIDFIEKVEEKIVSEESISYIEANYSQVDTTTIGGLTEGTKYQVVYHYSSELTTIPETEVTYGMNIAATISSLVDVQRKIQDELGDLWTSLLPLADKELQMYAIDEITTDMSSDAFADELKSKINEMLLVWK